MNDFDYPSTPLAPAPAAMVPAAFAEKTMASLMQLHGELMEEKERRVDLYHRLMEKEQSLAELRMYVQLLEDRLGVTPKDPPPAQPKPRPVSAVPPENVVPLPPRMEAAPRRAPEPPRPPPDRQRNDGWKAW